MRVSQNIQVNNKVEKRRSLQINTLLTLMALSTLSGIIYYAHENAEWRQTNPSPIVCTQEAKQCPDGSYVGRIGPSCEFAPCPQSPVEQTELLPQ